jgi:Ca2+:H+ antiporter
MANIQQFSIIALKNDHIALVQASLLGDIFSNNLLNIGCCFLAGGLWHREQYFNMSFMSVMSFIMVVASITIVVPTIIHFIVEHGSASNDIQDSTGLAHGSALVLLMAYFAYLTFQLRTHSDLFDDENCDIDVMAEEEEEMSILPMWAAASVLVLGVTLMSLCTQNIVTNIDIFAEQIHSSKRFVGFIIIPFLSNTVNTRTAVNVALVDKMDLAVTVAMGSSLQILLFIVPLLVLVAWMMGQSLTLSFGILEAVLLLLSSFVAISILEKGRSTYLDGVLCLALYVIVAMSMFVYASDTML